MDRWQQKLNRDRAVLKKLYSKQAETLRKTKDKKQDKEAIRQAYRKDSDAE